MDLKRLRSPRALFVLLLVASLFSSARAMAGGPVAVRGYTRKDGSYVAPHTRSAPGGGPSLAPRGTWGGDASPEFFGGAGTSPKSEAPTVRPKRVEPAAKTPAEDGLSPLTLGHVTVEIEALKVDKVWFGIRMSDRRLLAVRLRVLTDGTKPLSFKGWAGSDPQLFDEQDRQLAHVSGKEFGGAATGQYEGTGVARGGVRDVVIFEAPAKDAGELTLVLPGEFAEKSGVFEFVIPAKAVR